MSTASDLRPRPGDSVMVWIDRDQPTPPGWERWQDTPLCRRDWTGDEPAELPGRLLGISRAAIRRT